MVNSQNVTKAKIVPFALYFNHFQSEALKVLFPAFIDASPIIVECSKVFTRFLNFSTLQQKQTQLDIFAQWFRCFESYIMCGSNTSLTCQFHNKLNIYLPQLTLIHITDHSCGCFFHLYHTSIFICCISFSLFRCLINAYTLLCFRLSQ